VPGRATRIARQRPTGDDGGACRIFLVPWRNVFAATPFFGVAIGARHTGRALRFSEGRASAIAGP